MAGSGGRESPGWTRTGSSGRSASAGRKTGTWPCADFLRWLRDRRESYLLDQLAAGKLSVGSAYTAYTDNRLPALIATLRDGASDTDLEPYVARWAKEMERRKKPSAATRAKYVRQVRGLVPEGVPFRRSAFTKQRIRDYLGGLSIGQPNRNRAALSSFANYLVFDDVLPLNVVRQVPMAKESEPRTLHLSVEEAKRLVKALPAPYKALHALMLATGMEWSAARAVRVEDVGGGQVYAAGTKRSHRRRTVGVYDRWLWAWEVFIGGTKAVEDGPLFAGVSQWASHTALKKALAAAKLSADYTTHDHRHTWAVQAMKDRLPLPMISHNLGHRDSAMVLKVYGRFAPTGADFGRIATTSATAAIAAGGR